MWSKSEQELFQRLLLEYQPELTQKQRDLFLAYSLYVVEENQKINLTAITKPDEFVIKHVLDCLLVLKYLNLKTEDVIDVGTGAGMPGLIWAIVNETNSFVLLDSLAKRIGFLERAIERMNLKNVSPIHFRAEDAAKNLSYREKYGIVTARAVASLPVLLEYCLPFVKVGGKFLALKGPGVEEEVALCKNALDKLGGEIESVLSYELPLNMGDRSIVIVRKHSKTPKKYPRKAGTPSKLPL